MKESDWTIEEGEAGYNTIIHCAAPRFTAQWTSGTEDLADIDGPCWTNEGSDEDDTLHVFGFQWTDPAPAQPDFERLMSRAAVTLDEWIAARM